MRCGGYELRDVRCEIGKFEDGASTPLSHRER